MQDIIGRILFLVEIEFFQAILDDSLTVTRIIDDEVPTVEFRRLDFSAQEPSTEGMKCAEPYLFGIFANHAVYTIAHLCCRLVRECDRKDAIGRNALRQQVRDAAGEHLRFT